MVVVWSPVGWAMEVVGLQCACMIEPTFVCCCCVQYLVQIAWSMATLGQVAAAPLLEAVIGRAASDPPDQVLFAPTLPFVRQTTFSCLFFLECEHQVVSCYSALLLLSSPELWRN